MKQDRIFFVDPVSKYYCQPVGEPFDGKQEYRVFKAIPGRTLTLQRVKPPRPRESGLPLHLLEANVHITKSWTETSPFSEEEVIEYDGRKKTLLHGPIFQYD